MARKLCDNGIPNLRRFFFVILRRFIRSDEYRIGLADVQQPRLTLCSIRSSLCLGIVRNSSRLGQFNYFIYSQFIG